MVEYYFRLIILSVVSFLGLTNLAIAGTIEITNEGVEQGTHAQPSRLSFEMVGDEHNNIHIDIPTKNSSTSLKNGKYNYIAAMAPNYFADCLTLNETAITVNDHTVLKIKVSTKNGNTCHMTVH